MRRPPAVSSRRARLGRLVTVLAVAGAAAAPVQAAPPVTLLAPASGPTPVNVDTVRVEVVVSAPRAVLRLDGRVVERVTTRCTDHVVERRWDVDPGRHLVLVSAGGRRAGAGIEVDREAAAAPRNRIEAAATPSPFECLTRTGLTLQPGRALDLRRDRIVLVRAGVAREVDARTLGLIRLSARAYRFRRISGAFALRIGDDWGALDARGHRATARGVPDLAHAGEAVIGPAGGAIRLTDADGTEVTLTVPRDALARVTRIRVVPLAGAVAGSRSARSGLRFEPDGLVFARPATLTLRYGGTGARVLAGDRISLVTSPLTGLPLPGSADPARGTVTALLPHFSETAAGLDPAIYTDLQAWADAILSSAERPTLAEVTSLLELLELQQRTGCSERCLDPETVRAKAGSIVAALDREACAFDVADPSDLALQRWLALATVAQAAGADADAALACAAGVLRALILDAEDDLFRTVELARRAQLLGLDDLQELALERVDGALHSDIVDRTGGCAADPVVARERLAETRELALDLGRSALAREADAAAATCVRVVAQPQPPATRPPVVLATGCEADVAAPTDAAVDRWRAVETAAPGADVSAVRACITSLFAALVDEAGAAAGSSASDAQLQRLVDLSARALLYGYPAASTDALGELANSLRRLLAAASATCSSDPSASRATIDRVLSWAPQAAAVDSTLTADATAARSGCSVALRLTASIRSLFSVTCNCFPGGTEPSTEFRRDDVTAPTAPPVSGSAVTVGGTTGSYSISQPAPDRVVLAVALTQAANKSFLLRGTIEVTPESGGTLLVAFRDAWSDRMPGVGVMINRWFDDDLGTSRVAGELDPRGYGFAAGPAESSLDAAFTVVAGQAKRISFTIAAQDPATLSAEGTVLTLTLLP